MSDTISNRKGKVVGRDEIFEIAKKLVQDAGGGKVVADRMQVSKSLISQAIRYPEQRYDGARVRILKELGGYDVETIKAFLITKRAPK
jgi:hypothetical protein